MEASAKFKIRHKLMLLLSVVLIFTIGISLIGTNRLIKNFQRKNVRERDLVQTEQVIKTLLISQRMNLINQSQLVGALPLLATVVEDRDTENVIKTAKLLKKQLTVPIFDVIDLDGNLITSLDDSFKASGNRVRERFLVSQVLERGETLFSLGSRRKQPILLVAAPIGVSYEPSGVLMLGVYLDDAFAKKIEDLTETDTSFYFDNEITGSSLPKDDQTILLADIQRGDFLQAGPTVVLDTGRYLLKRMPLQDIQGNAVGQVIIQFSLEESETVFSNIRYSLLATGVLVFLVSIILGGYFLSRTLIGPVQFVADRLKDIAQGEGDLTKHLVVQSRDELGELAGWFNTFINKLRNLIDQVAQATSRMASSAVEMSFVAEQIVTGSEEIARQSQIVASSSEEVSARAGDVASFSEEVSSQAAAVTSISEAVSSQAGQVVSSTEEVSTQAEVIAVASRELSASAQEIAGNCTEVVVVANKAREASNDGQTIVEKTVDEMNRVAARVHESAQVIENLHRSSAEIGEILDVIDDIADQTNLLALNAAIEAARAGEHGRGFAIVAEEVRKLAEGTARSTQRIAEMVRTIRADTQNAFTSMEIGVREVETGTELASQAGRALETITEQVAVVTEMIAQVSTAAEQQRASTDSIATNIDQVTASSQSASRDVQQIARLSDEATRGVQQIAELSQQQTKGVQQIAETSQKATIIAHHIAEVSQQSASGARQSSQAISELVELSNHLEQLLGQFKIHNTREEVPRVGRSD